MVRVVIPGLLALLAALPACLPAADPTPVEEVWETAQVDGVRIGSCHVTVVRREDKVLEARSDLEIRFRRQGALLNLRMEQGTDEGEDGKVVGTFMRQHHPGGRTLVVVGTVEDGVLRARVEGDRLERKARWSDEVVGQYQLDHLFARRKPATGDRFTLLRYEPTFNSVLTVRVTVGPAETVDVSGVRRSLVRVEMTPDRIVTPTRTIQPTRVVWWLDADFVPVRRQIELEGLGSLILTRSTREAAQAPLPARLPDLGVKTLLLLNRAIPKPYDTRSATYRITLRDDPDPGSALVNDQHQEVKNLKGNTFELHVHPVQATPWRGGKAPEPPGDEFLAPSRYVDWDTPKVRALAGRAAGGEKIAWSQALRIEKWVKANVRVDNATALVPASQVAETLRGDCRAYALLTTALCRAEGIPARPVLGLIYVVKGRPQFGFHAWTEVWVEGKWVGLDATLGRGGVSATHVKVSDHSWHEAESLTPLLPVNRVLGKLSIEVLRVEGE